MLGVPWVNSVYQFLGYFFGHAENVAFELINCSSLNLATITIAWLFLVLVISSLCDDVTRGSFAFVLTRDNPRAGSIPSIGIFASSMQTKGGGFCFSSESNRPKIICWHLGGTVTFFTAFTNQTFSCEVVASEQGLAGSCSSIRRASCFVG